MPYTGVLWANSWGVQGAIWGVAVLTKLTASKTNALPAVLSLLLVSLSLPPEISDGGTAAQGKGFLVTRLCSQVQEGQALHSTIAQ